MAPPRGPASDPKIQPNRTGTPQPPAGPTSQQAQQAPHSQQQHPSAGGGAPPSGPQQHHPPTSTSKIDISATPTYNDKPLTSLNLEDDILPGVTDKPWRKPGADVTDYFNYGFDEFTWTAYCQKQQNLREEFNPAKLMEQMMMIGQFAMPGMVSSVPTGPAGMGVPGGMMDAAAAAAMMNIPPEMAAMMAAGGTGFAPGAGTDMAQAAAMMGMDPSMYGMGPGGAGGQGGFDGSGGAGGGYGMGQQGRMYANPIPISYQPLSSVS